MGIHERRAREKAQRKEQILAATREMLFEKGLDGLSVNQIAKRAELSPSALYTYFKNKEEILFTLAQEGLERLSQFMGRAMETSDSPRRRLEQLSRAYWDFSLEETDYFNVITYFLTSPKALLPDGLKSIAHEKARIGLDLAAAAIEEGIESGAFKKVDMQKAVFNIWANLNGVIQLRKLQANLMAGVDHEDLYQYAVAGLLDSLEK